MIERLEAIAKRYEEISSELVKPETVSNLKLTMELSKEQSSLSETYDVYQQYVKTVSSIEETKELAKDPEFAELSKEELVVLESQKEELFKKLEILLLPKDENDDKNVIVEIRGAAGGDEGNIFAGDLYDMYVRYAENNGFKHELINSEPGTAGGFAQIEFLIKGNGAYSKLKYESGAHRVQRVPETESQGRVHTSTATVLVMPEVEDMDFQIDEKDIRVDICRSTGAGGQGVNTTDSAVRMTHIPTGIMVYSQTERSQLKNREKAIKLLKSRVYEHYQREEESKNASIRKSKIGTGDRSEKIRTYNYPQNRVTDHRINYTTKQLDRIMNGKLDEVIEALITEDQKRKLAGE